MKRAVANLTSEDILNIVAYTASLPAFAGGRAVVWRNDNGDTHRIVANDGSFDTGDLAPGATSTMVQMPRIGLNYYCLIHPTTMFGAIGGGGGAAPPACEGVYCD